jgi:type I restriction-modification system DNA methylase subunit
LDIRTTENEFRSVLVGWLNDFLAKGNYPFEIATSDPSLEVSDSRKFPDVALWLNREARMGFCFWELKTPETKILDSRLLKNAWEKTVAINGKYFVTWNMQQAAIWELTEDNAHYQKISKEYPPIFAIERKEDWLRRDNQNELKKLAREILDDLAQLHKKGRLILITPDVTFFVNKIRGANDQLVTLFNRALYEMFNRDRAFRAEFEKWARLQGVPDPGSAEFFEVASRQAVYRLMVKILFYTALRFHRHELPPLDLPEVGADEAHEILGGAFAKARAIDWYAVFEEEFIDNVSWPEGAVDIIATLLTELDEFNFYDLAQDIFGAVFEQLIPYDDRHLLGQYFTREELVDFIDGFCIKTANDKVFDPTCGTGTFLLRAYDRLVDMGNRNHRDLLSALWGNDIAHFPASIATVNLFRQKFEDTANFPRVIAEDFFDIETGKTFPFPPPTKPGIKGQTIEVPVPTVDAIVSNFPYIRQELIEKKVKGYKDKINGVLEADWPEFRERLSGQADIYAFMFLHAAKFLKPGGRLGVVTSNAWLDTRYGYVLQKFLLEKFKLVAIVESRCEPWFEQAAVNTIFTVVERCNDEDERRANPVKFVKVKRRLKDMFPEDLKREQKKRWSNVNSKVSVIENAGREFVKLEGTAFVNTLSGHKRFENGDFVIRVRNQAEMYDELLETGKTVKWGKYLRAPEVYFEIKDDVRFKELKKVAEVNRGLTTNNVGYFYLEYEDIETHKIEEEFIKGPVVYSPREVRGLEVDKSKLKKYLFYCNKSKNELRGSNAIKYIEYGENSRVNRASSFARKGDDWYILSDVFEAPCSLTYARHDELYRVPYNPDGLIVNDNLYYVLPFEGIDNELLNIALNHILTILGVELGGRLNLGEGALKIQVYEFEDVLIPFIFQLPKKERQEIKKAYLPLKRRPLRKIYGEIKSPDRRAFDETVLKALDLDPDKYLDRLYEGVERLVTERIQLGKMRAKIKKSRVVRDLSKVKEEVLRGFSFRPFPEDFVGDRKPDEYKHVGVTNGPYSPGGFFMGKYDVLNVRGELMYQADSELEARFVIYSHKPDTYSLQIPVEPQVIQNAVVEYERYLNDEYERLFRAFADRLGDVARAERLTNEVFADYGVPLVFRKE